jgi:hypothetical protein
MSQHTRLVLATGDLTPCCAEPARRGFSLYCPYCGQLYRDDGKKAAGWGHWTGRTPRRRLRRPGTGDASGHRTREAQP